MSDKPLGEWSDPKLNQGASGDLVEEIRGLAIRAEISRRRARRYWLLLLAAIVISIVSAVGSLAVAIACWVAGPTAP